MSGVGWFLVLAIYLVGAAVVSTTKIGAVGWVYAIGALALIVLVIVQESQRRD
jgi:hypothetical protein